MISTATRFGPNPWTNGLRLAFANLVLAALCAGSFVGVLLVISWVNRLGYAHGGPFRDRRESRANGGRRGLILNSEMMTGDYGDYVDLE